MVLADPDQHRRVHQVRVLMIHSQGLPFIFFKPIQNIGLGREAFHQMQHLFALLITLKIRSLFFQRLLSDSLWRLFYPWAC